MPLRMLVMKAAKESEAVSYRKNTNPGEYSQNFLGQFVRFFVTLGLKIMRIFRLKVFLKQMSLKGDVNFCINHKEPIFFIKHLKVTKSFVNSHPGV
jgi:hypothetical protein